jgi:hypothetical protein
VRSALGYVALAKDDVAVHISLLQLTARIVSRRRSVRNERKRERADLRHAHGAYDVRRSEQTRLARLQPHRYVEAHLGRTVTGWASNKPWRLSRSGV